jgi:RNA polymerase sigma-70 factor (ECF subfamily)
MNAPTSDELDTRDMARLNEGHDAALNDLMERHAGRLFHYLIRSLQDEEDAADLAQETFAKLYHSRSKFDPAQKFSTWLYAIASNLVRDRYRWRSRHPQVSLDIENEENKNSLKENLRVEGPAPDEQMQAQERAVAVRNAVATLPEELRQPLILAVYQGLPQAEIAAILNCSVKAVETRIYRARQQLRTSLNELMQIA